MAGQKRRESLYPLRERIGGPRVITLDECNGFGDLRKRASTEAGRHVR